MCRKTIGKNHVRKNHSTMDMKIKATRKMRKKCDTFPKEKKNSQERCPRTLMQGGYLLATL
jgi:hypothetical protein